MNWEKFFAVAVAVLLFVAVLEFGSAVTHNRKMQQACAKAGGQWGHFDNRKGCMRVTAEWLPIEVTP
jgi:hypothetical protein